MFTFEAEEGFACQPPDLSGKLAFRPVCSSVSSPEEPVWAVTAFADRHVDQPGPLDGGLHGGFGVPETGDAGLGHQQTVLLTAQSPLHGFRTMADRHDLIADGQRRRRR
jgi:hypothetical protein